MKPENKIKLIIVDFYGVMTLGSYRETCYWLAEKYHLPFKKFYDVVYHKYFSAAAVGRYTERQSFELPIKELGLKETWHGLRRRHLSFQKLNKPVFNLARRLQAQGYTILLLSKNTPPQFNYALKKMHTRRYFKNIINTYDLGLPKASPHTIRWVLKKFKLKPSQVVMVDDQDFNLPAAKRIGVKTIYYQSFAKFCRELTRALN